MNTLTLTLEVHRVDSGGSQTVPKVDSGGSQADQKAVGHVTHSKEILQVTTFSSTKVFEMGLIPDSTGWKIRLQKQYSRSIEI